MHAKYTGFVHPLINKLSARWGDHARPHFYLPSHLDGTGVCIKFVGQISFCTSSVHCKEESVLDPS
jgi:hypothetical protein